MSLKGFYPAPNPRVISVKDEKTFEQYLEQVGDDTLFEVFALYLLTVSFDWVVNYSRIHDNYLPNRQISIFQTTEELINCLTLCEKFDTISPESFDKLVAILPQSSWYCHPTYPATLYQFPT